MSCEENVKKILSNRIKRELLQHKKYLDKIKELCSKGSMDENQIAEEVINEYLRDERLKVPSLSTEESGEIGGGNYLNQENKEVADNSENPPPRPVFRM